MTDSPEGRRRLVLLRHAKSAWPDVPDHDRPLAPRGGRDAPVIGQWLRAHGYVPDQVVCSSARRTRETWQLVAEQLANSPQVRFDEQVYQATPGGLLEVIRQAEPTTRTLLVVGHAPGIPGLALMLPAAGKADPALAGRMNEKYPTAAVAVLDFAGPWAGLRPGGAGLLDFVTPRRLS